MESLEEHHKKLKEEELLDGEEKIRAVDEVCRFGQA